MRNYWILGSTYLLLSAGLHASPLQDLLRQTLQTHALMQAVEADVKSVESQLKAEKANWYPKFSAHVQTGKDDIRRNIGENSNLTNTQVVFGLHQLLWDFGATDQGITRVTHVVENKNLERDLQRQNLILAGTEAYIKVKKAHEVLEHAKRSEENIKQQASLESARIDAGRGYSTDLLQAKAQLAGAQARRVGAEGALNEAQNRFLAVFGQYAEQPSALRFPLLPTEQMPASLDALLHQVKSTNPDVLPALSRAEIARIEARQLKAKEFYPRVSASLENRHLEDVEGVEDTRHENALWVEADWQFDLGMRQSHSVSAANEQIVSKQETADYVLLQATEEARNAWNGLQTAIARRAYLRDQVDISAQFLKLSRTERELGRRSLLDVLSGETTLINAQSDLVAADADVSIAGFRVLRAMGRLNLESLAYEQH